MPIEEGYNTLNTGYVGNETERNLRLTQCCEHKRYDHVSDRVLSLTYLT